MSIIFLTYTHIVQLIVLYTGSFQNFCIGGLDIAVCPDHIFALFHLPLLTASLIILFYHFCILSSFPKTGPKTKSIKSSHPIVPDSISQKQFPGAGNPHKSSIHKNLSSQKGLPEIPFLFFTMSFRTLF